LKFPQNFIWSAAESSYQIEGAACSDGGGHSIGDMLGRQQGKIIGGDTREIASDHYHRYREDVGFLADLGMQAWRFPVSWRRSFVPNDVNQL